MFKSILKGFLFFLLIALLYLLLYPIPFDPVAYTPPPNPGLKGDFEKNEKLQKAEKILEGKGHGPEAIVLGADSLFYTGYKDGRIIQFSEDGQVINDFANTGGRPLGMKFDQQGNLIVADALKGLLSINPSGNVTLLTNEVEGTKINYADDVGITSDGMIYFSDATQRSHDVKQEVWELRATGRLLSYNPKTKETKVEFGDMRFANGIAISPTEDYLLITETIGMLIHKYWLKGVKKGQKEIWVNELPGFPDNITYNGQGIYWLAIPSLRVSEEFERLFEKPFIRKVIARLPKFITEAQEPAYSGMVIGFDESGKVIHNFQDPLGGIHSITSVNDINGTLYLGSLNMDAAAKYKY